MLNVYGAGRFVVSSIIVILVIWINVVAPELSADKAAREAKNEFFLDLQRGHKELYGRGIALSDPAMQQIYEFDGMEARKAAVVLHFENIKYPMAIFYLIVLGFGVCRMWAAGCMAALLIFPMALTREYSIFAFQLGGVLLGVAVYFLLARRKKIPRNPSG
ncbi:MAG: hypothetical protein V2I38_02550 [Alcanivoracaceae bacterium]|jgi:hypothetical protein|nr:hypothetical protein [Alcanivoracaceae bacterium]